MAVTELDSLFNLFYPHNYIYKYQLIYLHMFVCVHFVQCLDQKCNNKICFSNSHLYVQVFIC
jgi:hypothetical protein